jgi:hypothetical protein
VHRARVGAVKLALKAADTDDEDEAGMPLQPPGASA